MRFLFFLSILFVTTASIPVQGEVPKFIIKPGYEYYTGVRQFPITKNCKNFPCWGYTGYIIVRENEKSEYKTFYWKTMRNQNQPFESLAVAQRWTQILKGGKELFIFFQIEKDFRSGVFNRVADFGIHGQAWGGMVVEK